MTRLTRFSEKPEETWTASREVGFGSLGWQRDPSRYDLRLLPGVLESFICGKGFATPDSKVVPRIGDIDNGDIDNGDICVIHYTGYTLVGVLEDRLPANRSLQKVAFLILSGLERSHWLSILAEDEMLGRNALGASIGLGSRHC